MNLNRKELQKIQYDFNSYSNRLLQADINDYIDILTKYLVFLEITPIINDYIQSCGECEIDVESLVHTVQSSYGREIFVTGDNEKEEVRNVYAILRYIIDSHQLRIHGIVFGYSASKSYQDKLKGFNNRFVMVLIRYIESYLTKVGIDMGMDDNVTFNVNVDNNSQSIIAMDNASVTAVNQNGIDANGLNGCINNIRDAAVSLNPNERSDVEESLEVIEEESAKQNPKKSLLKTALKTLKDIKEPVEFVSEVIALGKFLAPILGL